MPSRRNTLYMETTQIAATKTAEEVIRELVRGGARQIATDYSAAGDITGLRWVMEIQGRPAAFAMPARVEPVYLLLKSRRKGQIDSKQTLAMRQQAERVAWRQLLRWIEAQLAMVETGMADAGEVFLPYMLRDGGRTFWQYVLQDELKALPPAPGGSHA